MSEDELELDILGDRKTALFVIISDTDDTFNFVVSIMYSQLFNLLCDKADDVYGGRLPIHVRARNISIVQPTEKKQRSNAREMQDLRRDLRDVEEQVADVVDTLSNVVHKSELSELILDFSNPPLKYGFLLLNGQPIEANLAYKDIYGIAKKSVYIVDNYIGVKTLVLVKEINPSVEIIIFSDNIGKGLHTLEYQDFCREYPQVNIKFQKSGKAFHDRYIIIDWNTDNQRIYHCGASSKDAGQKITSILEVADQMIYTDLINKLLKNPILKLK